MKFKKNKKVTKGAFGWFSSLNPDAGDVEYNNKVFNNSTDISTTANSNSSSTNMSSGSGMGEDLESNVDKYKIVKYGQWWYGILDTETNIMLRVGPNPDYNGPLDDKENKLLLLFKSKEKAQEYIDNNINNEQKLKENLIESEIQEIANNIVDRMDSNLKDTNDKTTDIEFEISTTNKKEISKIFSLLNDMCSDKYIDYEIEDEQTYPKYKYYYAVLNRKYPDDYYFDYEDDETFSATQPGQRTGKYKKEESIDMKFKSSKILDESLTPTNYEYAVAIEDEDEDRAFFNNYKQAYAFAKRLAKNPSIRSEFNCDIVVYQTDNNWSSYRKMDTIKIEPYEKAIAKNNKLEESADDNNKNSIEVEVKSGINGDGFKVIVKDIDGNIIEQDDFSYGYNASHSKDWVDKDKPFVTDIINSYLSKYNLSKDDLILTKGKNTFKDKDISDEVIDRFKTKYLSESAKHLDTDYQKKNIIDYYEMVIDPYGDLQSSFESEEEYRQSLMNQLSNIDYIDEWINQYSDESGFVEMLKELKATITDNNSTVEEVFESDTNDDNKLTTYYQVYSRYESDNKFVFIDEFDTVKEAVDEALYHMDNGSQVKVFAVEEDTDGNIVGKRQELLIYSDNAIQNWSDSEFDVADPQEVANMFGKPTYSNKNGKVYFPKATEALKEYVESDEFIALENKLRTTLKEKGIKLNTAECTPEDATEYILMTRENTGDAYYSVEDWIKDTLNNYPEMLITNESIELAHTDDIDDEYEENLDEQMIKEDTIPVADTTSYTLEYGINGKTSDVHYLDNLDRYEVKNLVEDLLMTDEYDYIYVTKRYTIERDGHFNTVYEDVLDAYLDGDNWITNIDKMHLIDNSNLTIDNM